MASMRVRERTMSQAMTWMTCLSLLSVTAATGETLAVLTWVGWRCERGTQCLRLGRKAGLSEQTSWFLEMGEPVVRECESTVGETKVSTIFGWFERVKSFAAPEKRKGQLRDITLFFFFATAGDKEQADVLFVKFLLMYAVCLLVEGNL